MMILNEVNESFLVNSSSKNEIMIWLKEFDGILSTFDYKVGTTVSLDIEDEQGKCYKLVSSKLYNKNNKYGINLTKSGSKFSSNKNKIQLDILPDSISFTSTTENKYDGILGTSTQSKVEYKKTQQGYDRLEYLKIVNNTEDDEQVIASTVLEKNNKSTYLVDQGKTVEWSRTEEDSISSYSKGTIIRKKSYTRQAEDPTLIKVKKDKEEFVAQIKTAVIPQEEVLKNNVVAPKKQTSSIQKVKI